MIHKLSNNFGLFIAGITVTAAVLFGFVQIAKANPAFLTQTATNAATTTYNAISSGNGTTTVVWDAGNGSDQASSVGAVLNLIMNASTSAPVVKVVVQQSYNGVDWFIPVVLSSTASTTASTHLQYTVTFATSTITTDGGILSGSNGTNTVMRSIELSTPSRFVRAIIYGAVGNGSLWAQIVGKKER